jgi:hypothetical protein
MNDFQKRRKEEMMVKQTKRLARVERVSRITVRALVAVLVGLLFLPNSDSLSVSAQESYDAPLSTAIRDGELNGAIGYEWIDANSQGVKIGRFDAILFLKHDGENLYFGLQIPTGERFDSLELYAAFDANRNGSFFDRGDDIVVITLEEGDLVRSEEVDYFYQETYQFALDKESGGRDNAIALVAARGEGRETVYTAELRKSLVGDPEMDISLTPGDTIDVVFGVIGSASPPKEQVSRAIRVRLRRAIEAGFNQVGLVQYKDIDKDKRLEIRIPRQDSKNDIEVDPDRFDWLKPTRTADVDGVWGWDWLWDRDVDKDGVKETVIDLFGDGIDLVQDGIREYSVGLNPYRIELVRTKKKGKKVFPGGVRGPRGTVPAGAELTIIVNGKKYPPITALENGSFFSKKITEVKNRNVTIKIKLTTPDKKASTMVTIFTGKG